MREIITHHCSPLCHYLLSNIYIVQRSMEYQINDECSDFPTCLRGVFQHYRGHELKKFFFCSIHVFKPPSTRMISLAYGLKYVQYHTQSGRQLTFIQQLRYFHFLYCYMKCCWLLLLELARQPLFVPLSKPQNFNYLHPSITMF